MEQTNPSLLARYRDPQIQVCEKYSYLWNLRPNICKSWCLNTHFIANNSDFLFQLSHVFDQLGRCICRPIPDIGRSWIQPETPWLGVNHANSCLSTRRRRYPFTHNVIIKCQPCCTWLCIPLWARRRAFNEIFTCSYIFQGIVLVILISLKGL